MSKLLRTFLYSTAYPRGFLHEGLTEGDEANLLENGWYDHPAKVPGAPESMKNLTGGQTVTRGQRPAQVTYSNDDLRAMFLSGKELTGSMVARLATAVGIEVPEGMDEEGVRHLINEALSNPNEPPTAGTAMTADKVRKLEGNAPQPKPLAPAKKAPAKKAGAKK